MSALFFLPGDAHWLLAIKAQTITVMSNSYNYLNMKECNQFVTVAIFGYVLEPNIMSKHLHL